MLTLRSYQREALVSLNRSFSEGTKAPLIVMPTGSGKSPTLCAFIKETLERWPDERILVLTHVRELVEQGIRTMLRIWPEAPFSVYSAGLGHRDLSGQVVFASIQSVYKRAYDLQKVDLVIVDEAHLIPASGDGMYRRLMNDLATINGGTVPMIGFTATPFRLSSGSLVEGEGRVFDGIAHEVGLLELIDAGYLCPPVTKAGIAKIDTSGVGTRNGEFIAAQAQEAADREDLVEAACDEIVAIGKSRRSWLVFSQGVKHALHLRDAIRRRGVTCETVTGETPAGERDRIVSAHKSGLVRCLTNDSVLTTGYDNPIVDLIAVLRMTQSAGLWTQIVGRGMRPAEGKTEVIVLDYGGNAMRHGPIDQIKGRAKGAPKAEPTAPMRECPECASVIPISALTCPDCSHEFPVDRDRPKHAAEADVTALLSSQVSDWLPVSRVDYREHRKPGGLPTLRADYRCGLATYSEWVCLEHDGYARSKAERWWNERSEEQAPDLVADALTPSMRASMRTPTAIRVRPDGRWHKVAGVRF